MQETTIAAIATAPGAGGIAVVRLSGAQSYAVAERVFRPANPGKKVAQAKGYTALFGSFVEGDEAFDEGVALFFRAPHSYTGEDVVELSCHGGSAVARRLVEACLAAGAQPAAPGEYTRRAFLNGKLGLTQAEAVMDLISADGRQGAALANAALSGALARKIGEQKDALTALQAHLAAWVDFPEEDVPELDEAHLRSVLGSVQETLDGLIRNYQADTVLREGVDCAIVGRPNAGKSTLLNLLAGFDRAIVTPVAGTTRDVVEQAVQLGDIRLNLFDTAGLRETEDAIEAEGIRRSWKKLEEAGLILAVFDGSEPPTREDLELAQRSYDYEKAGAIQYSTLPQLQKQLEAEEQLAAQGKQSSLLRNAVTEEEIARIVERWTGIPVAKLMEGEREKLLHLEDILHQRVIGQDEAVSRVAEAILRSRAGIQDPNRPIGSFLFLGPTGVGKTELAKTLAATLFDDEKNLVRIDMSEYMEKYSVSRLIGAPPGYVGYEEGGQLTEAVRRKPYSVVLFDEVEKAHPDVFNILLQVLDDGRITDSQGRTVDFKNTVIILTSNLGSDIILNDLEQRRAQGSNELSDEARKQIDLLLKSKFRPEFLNRLDEIVYYKSLTKDEMRKIVDLQLNDLRKRMDEGKHLKLEVTTAAKDFIIDSAYDSVYGARPIKRFIQSRVETLIAKAIIQGSYAEGNTLTVDYDGSALVLR